MYPESPNIYLETKCIAQITFIRTMFHSRVSVSPKENTLNLVFQFEPLLKYRFAQSTVLTIYQCSLTSLGVMESFLSMIRFCALCPLCPVRCLSVITAEGPVVPAGPQVL